MDDVAIGRLFRSIRVRLGLRQGDVAARASLRQQAVSDVELGRLETVGLGVARGVAKALGAEIVLTVRWRGAEIDRLRDEDHAALVGRLASTLEGLGWLVATEVTFSEYGERGSYDLLAFHPDTRTLLVVEVKTELVSAEATLRSLDTKVRLGPRIAAERFGWRPAAVVRLLAVQETTTNHRRVAAHADLFRRGFPVRARAARGWLRSPAAIEGGGILLFLPHTAASGGRRATAVVKRVRRTAPRTGRARSGVSEAGIGSSGRLPVG